MHDFFQFQKWKTKMTAGGFDGNYDRLSTAGSASSMRWSSLGSMSALNSFSSRGTAPLYHRDRGSFSFLETRNETKNWTVLRCWLNDPILSTDRCYNLPLSIDRYTSKDKDIVQCEEWNRLTWIGLNMQSLESWSAAEVNVDDDLEVGIIVVKCTVFDQWYKWMNEETQWMCLVWFRLKILCCCLLFHLMKIWD